MLYGYYICKIVFGSLPIYLLPRFYVFG